MTEWNPDHVLQAAAQEREVRGMDYKQLAHARMEENLDFAVARIVHLIKYSASEKMAFDASKYLLERVLGKTPEPEQNRDQDDLEDLVRQLADNDHDQ